MNLGFIGIKIKNNKKAGNNIMKPIVRDRAHERSTL